jgi:hypothetical protein
MYLSSMVIVRCAECRCTPQECAAITLTSKNQKCVVCKRDDTCCCYAIHNDTSNSELIEKPPSKPKKTMLTSVEINGNNNDCCSSGSCKNDDNGVKPVLSTKPTQSSLFQFFKHVKELYVVALGIEILCIAAAEIGENTGLRLFGFNTIGIPAAYAMGYALAGFTTFATILGRYDYGSNDKIVSCCSVLEQVTVLGFIPNLKGTFRNFVVGISKLPNLHRQPDLKYVLKTSLYILVTAESACILTAETVGLVFYQYFILLSIPLALLAGAFTAVAPEAYRKMIKQKAV